MVYRRFGRTELEMPVLSCGGMRYQHKWQDVPLEQVPAENQKNLEACVRRAVEVGINHIETARGYGSSERQLGEVLPNLPREKMIIQTKVAPTAEAKQFVKDFEDSLGRLKLGYVDLLALHGVNDRQTLEWSIGAGGCLTAAREIQKRGLARHIGFSTHGPTSVILAAVRHEADGGFDYVNLHWYYIFQKNFVAIEEAHRRDMGVFIISPSDKGGMLYDPPPKMIELCRPLHPIVFNDLFCLARNEVHTLSVGAAKPSDFDLHLEAVGMLEQAEGYLPGIVQRLRKAMRDAVEAEFLDPFGMGLPLPDQMPGQVNLPVILWLRNLVKAYDLKKYGQMRYNLLGNGGHWFPGQGAENVDEVTLVKALGERPWAGRIVAILRETHEMLKKEKVSRLSKSEGAG